MNAKRKKNMVETIEAQLRNDLESRHGLTLGGRVLWSSLGYPSAEAFRQACVRKLVRVRLFTMSNRRGKFALAKDVARCVAERWAGADTQTKGRKKPAKGGGS